MAKNKCQNLGEVCNGQYHYKVDGFPAGFLLEDAQKGDTPAFCSLGFATSNDKDEFNKDAVINAMEVALENAPTDLLDRFKNFDHTLLVIHRDKNVYAYVDDLDILAIAVARRKIKKNQYVTREDIKSIKSVKLGVDIPKDAGYVFISTVGVIKLFVFDYTPLVNQSSFRDYDVEQWLGALYTNTIFEGNLFSER